ncbi:MAG TPA: AcvB/VirJ family lysyl-phosphatidylglycerol hydrolase [Bacteroidales bacterium]
MKVLMMTYPGRTRKVKNQMIKTLLTLILVLLFSSAIASKPDSLKVGSFGVVKIYKPVSEPTEVILFISGDGGWNLGVVDMAIAFSGMNAMVVGIDITRYYKNLQKTNSECYYPASDFENLSKTIQEKYKFNEYINPVIVGYSSGATLAYGILAQAPAHTFKGVISLGFCPDIEINRTLCTGSGLKSHVLKEGKSFFLEANSNLQEPFYVLQGQIDKVCDFKSTSDYLKQIPNSFLVSLPGVGHGFSVQRNWMPQMKDAFNKIIATDASKINVADAEINRPDLVDISGLPYHLVNAAGDSIKGIMFFISGDGGFTSFDESICSEFAKKGYAVIGLDALKYFWGRKEATDVVADVQKLLTYYKNYWKKSDIIFVGYSFGADALPVIVNRLSAEFKSQTKIVGLLSPTTSADLEIHVGDMLSLRAKAGQYDLAIELNNLTFARTVCLYGDDEKEEIKSKISNPKIEFVTVKGGHHFSSDFKKLTELILQKK